MPTNLNKALSLTGEVAHRRIAEHLWGYAKAQTLAQELHDFYGGSLKYVESRDFSASRFAIDIQHEPDVALNSVSIELQLGDKRLQEALVHEILHLQLPIIGFPTGEKVNIPDNLDKYAPFFLDAYSKIANLVQHEIILSDFMALGFSKKNFLGTLAPPMDYKQKVIGTLQQKEQYFPEIGFPWFCLEFFRHWITVRHSVNKDLPRYAESAVESGSMLHPELKKTTTEIVQWVENGAFKDSNQYAQQFNMLLEIMRIPKFTSWVLLKGAEPQKPIATRLE